MLEYENSVEKRIRVIEGLLAETTDKMVKKMLDRTLERLLDEQKEDNYER